MNKRQRRASLQDQAEKILAGANARENKLLTEDERKQLASINAEITQLTADIELEDTIAANAARLEASVDRIIDPPSPNQAAAPVAVQPAQAGSPAQHLTVVPNPRAHLPFRSLGEQFQAIAEAARRPHSADDRLEIVHKAALESMRTAGAQGQSGLIPADGGFLLQTDFAQDLIKATAEGSMLLQKAQRVPLSPGADSIEIPIIENFDQSGGSVSGGFLVYLRDEAASYQKTQMKFGKKRLVLTELDGICYATDSMLRNVPALQSLMAQGFQDQYAYKIDDLILWGPGGAAPLGIMNAKNSALMVATKKNGQAAATVIFENVNKMNSLLQDEDEADAIWLVGVAVSEQLPLMSLAVGTAGIPVYLPASGAAGSGNASLFGKPVRKSGHVKALGAQGDIMLLNPRRYYWIDRGTPEMATSIHVRFDTGETAFRFTYYCTGLPSYPAQKKLPSGETVSPYITLAVRS